jgi:hypothetical protein
MRQPEGSRRSRRAGRPAAAPGRRHGEAAAAAQGDPDRPPPENPVPISEVLDHLRDAAAAHDDELRELVGRLLRHWPAELA